ncbi:MAG TPA: sigma-54 dependent transcriptional regulator [Gemmatimonadaceae bacterium]|nr:sigma-54 dependent transcriptional regulator [Gemmatimonadaceae bacterium]
MATILCLDDEPAIGLILQDTLERAGHQTVSAHNVPQALQALAVGSVDLIISDYRMPGLTGLEFLALLRQEGYETPLIMLTGYGSIEHAVAAIKAGAIDYITKPVRPEQLELAVKQALEVVRLRRENERLRKEVMEYRNERQIIGDSPAIRRVLQTVATAAPTRATVLLEGESGTGKELFARAIHAQSERRDGPFIKLNCAALPEGLVESALFGHEKGAFTGAIKRVEGAFERANGGTLLLDEISEMRLDLQAKLLRVLQEQEFERVGGSSAIKVDVRIIATTNRDLAAYSAAGHFRQDLYYRLGVIPVRLPPLRERKEDIPLLAYRFASHYAQEIGKEISGIAPDALSLLQQYDWPGNVRELQHAVERAVILSGEKLIPLHAFDGQRFGLSGAWSGPTPSRISGDFAAISIGSGTPAVGTMTVPDGAVVLTSLNVGEAEAKLIERALEVSSGNRTKAAELLGISVRTLRNKLNAEKVGADGGGSE